MPITMEWADASRSVLLFHYQGEWTMADYKQSNVDGRAAIGAVSWPVVLIAEIQPGSSFEGGILTMTDALKDSVTEHPQVLGVVTVNLTPALKALAQLYNRLLAPQGEEVVMVSDLPAALAAAESILARHQVV